MCLIPKDVIQAWASNSTRSKLYRCQNHHEGPRIRGPALPHDALTPPTMCQPHFESGRHRQVGRQQFNGLQRTSSTLGLLNPFKHRHSPRVRRRGGCPFCPNPNALNVLSCDVPWPVNSHAFPNPASWPTHSAVSPCQIAPTTVGGRRAKRQNVVEQWGQRHQRGGQTWLARVTSSEGQKAMLIESSTLHPQWETQRARELREVVTLGLRPCTSEKRIHFPV